MTFLIDCSQLSSSGYDFIDEPALTALLDRKADAVAVRAVIEKSLSKTSLSLEETAMLLAAGPGPGRRIFAAARQLKRDVYGNRIVLFAPAVRGKRLHQRLPVLRVSPLQPRAGPPHAHARRPPAQVEALLRSRAQADDPGLRRAPPLQPAIHRRLRAAGLRGEARQRRNPPRERQRRAAGPCRAMRTIKEAQIGTYQIFQETYHHETYARCIRRAPAKATISGGWTALPGPWRPAATTWASARCSGCTIGGSRCWGW